jgi:protease I
MKKSVLIILPSDNFNDAEYNAIKNALENAGVKIFIGSDADSICKGEKRLRVQPDVKFFNVNPANFDAIVVIGGSGIIDYWKNKQLHGIVRNFSAAGKPTAAICAAPVVFSEAGILEGKKGVCYPKSKKEFTRKNVEYVDFPVVRDGNIITARDYSAADELALTLIQMIS